MGFYTRARQGIKDAGVDLMNLGRGLEQSYANKDFGETREALHRYVGTDHAGKVMTAGALVGAGAIAELSQAEQIAGGVIAGIGAPFAGKVFYRGDLNDAVEEEARAQRQVNELSALLETTPSDSTVEGGSNSQRTRTASAEDLADWSKQKNYLEGTTIPNARHAQGGVRRRQQALGAGLTASGLGLLAVLRQMNNQEEAPQPTLSQTVNQSPYPAPQQTQGTMGMGLTQLNADFTNAPTLMVPPVNNNLLNYWGSGLVGEGY